MKHFNPICRKWQYLQMEPYNSKVAMYAMCLDLYSVSITSNKQNTRYRKSLLSFLESRIAHTDWLLDSGTCRCQQT